MINEEDKILIIGKQDVNHQELIKKLKETNLNVVVVDDINSAKDLLRGEYHKEIEKVYKYEAPFLHQNPWAGDLTKKQLAAKDTEPVRTEPKIQNNEPCPCGSGKKYKKCCK